MSATAVDDEAIRLAVYRDLAATGRAPEPSELAERLGVARVIREGLRRLAHANDFARAGLSGPFWRH